ncbi:MAG TPA: glycoside hydrolase family 9 protein [Acidobacteriaceae bacterium]|nr:glycoside hydrolase family 9 protein [Acidobacteriaceae bacterium]
MKRRAVLKYISAWSASRLLPSSGPLVNAAAFNLNRIAFNQAGYLQQSEKIASLQLEDERDRTFQIFSEPRGHSVFEGRLSEPMIDASSGDSVSLADFSRLNTAGKYRLVTQGVRSQPFVIGNDVYVNPLLLCMRAFYGQRCGCAVDLGDGYRYSICHQADAFHPSSGRTGVLPNHGGWHDAGDYGRYVVNSAIATGTLLWAWDLYPTALHSLSLRIPESGGKLPDYLAEVRWNLEWMLSLQDLDGGVWHKQTSEQFCGFVMPQNDRLTSYVIGTGKAPYKSTCATAGLAAVMAIAARCYGEYDATFAALCLAAAKRGWSWAIAHPDVGFANPPGIETGAYGDTQCHDYVLWASAELWRTTRDHQYEQAFLHGQQSLTAETSITAPSWTNVTPLAYWAYAFTEQKADDAMHGRVLGQTRAAAQTLLSRRRFSGYGTTLDPTDYFWGSNSVAANQSLLLLIANHLQPERGLLEAALGNLHYLLGRNCFGVSWVTHVGTNPFQHPHHRPSIADQLAAPWPGLLSGGPNAQPEDKVARALPKLPPMRMWVDDAMAPSLNEVAINWNAPLVFLLAGANALSH